jgi:hypothetical protein
VVARLSLSSIVDKICNWDFKHAAWAMSRMIAAFPTCPNSVGDREIAWGEWCGVNPSFFFGLTHRLLASSPRYRPADAECVCCWKNDIPQPFEARRHRCQNHMVGLTLTNALRRFESGVVRARKFGGILFTGFEANHQNGIRITTLERKDVRPQGVESHDVEGRIVKASRT